MKRNYTKSELDYIVSQMIKFFEQESLKDQVTAGTIVRDLYCSTRLGTVLSNNVPGDWTIREVAKYDANEYKRFRGMGRKTFSELESIVIRCGLQFGNKRFKDTL